MVEVGAFTAELVEEWLVEAKAKKPWAHPERLSDAAATMAHLSERSAGLPDDSLYLLRLLRQAQRAVTELRRVLPPVLAAWVSAIATKEDGVVPTNRPALLQQTVQVAAMHRSLIDVLEIDIDIEKIVLDWHGAAVLLFSTYRSVVGSGKPTANGPAARFIKKALADTHFGEHTTDAIEKALNRYDLFGRRLGKPSG